MHNNKNPLSFASSALRLGVVLPDVPSHTSSRSFITLPLKVNFRRRTMSIAVEKPVHKRYRKYGETKHLLEPVYQDTRQTGQQRAVRVALLLIAQPTDGSQPSQALQRQAEIIEEAALDAPTFVRETLLTW
jgi:hypothetical protein